MREVVILGSTGSIGVQALEVIESNPELFSVVAITSAGNNPELVIAQAKKFKVSFVGVINNVEIIRQRLPGVTVVDGFDSSSIAAAISCDIVLNAITGSIGLGPTLAALKAGNILALANKESLVAGGDLVLAAAAPGQIIPVDSEHSAVFQSALSGKKSEIKKIILTASGGPFRNRENLDGISVEEALRHPTWTMGSVVTINSATLVNKGLEIIEAHYLFDIPYTAIEAVIHPQSVVHSLVEFHDGSTIAQASPPNMKGAIAYALNWPQRLAHSTAPIDWKVDHVWTFEPIDTTKFPSIELARHCGQLAGAMPAIFNAANEVAVEAFLANKVEFKTIVSIVDHVVHDMEKDAPKTLRDISDVSAIEDAARTQAKLQLLRLVP